MSFITRIVLLVLSVSFVLADNGDCGRNQFKSVSSISREENPLTYDLGGIVRTAAFPMGDRAILPVHLPTQTVLTTGRGTPDWAAVPLTSQPTTPPLLSARTTGNGLTIPFVATLLQVPTPPHPLHPAPPDSLLMTIITGTNAIPFRSANTALGTLHLALGVSLLVLFPT